MANQVERALVPQGLEQGARQQIVGDRQQAGLPQGVSLQRQGIPSDFLAATAPTRQPDVAALLAPAAPQQDRLMELRAMRDTTPNTLMRELLSRMIGD